MFALSPDLWAPQRRACEQTIDALARVPRVLLYSPTGSGKTRIAIELFRWAASGGLGGAFYVNRKLLVSQTSERFAAAGLDHGVRAADFEDLYRPDEPFQVCSIDTERARVQKRGTWKRHDVQGGLVIVDEAHIQKSDAMRETLAQYREDGAMIVLLTATPVGLSDWADELVISGKLQEYRDCKALVPAIVRSIEQPDLSKVKRNPTGEFILDGKKKTIYTQSIVGNVLGAWKKWNPDARPTMLYAPGKPESVWFAEQFTKMGVSACHVDATDAVLNGERMPLTPEVWQELILPAYKSGEINVLCSRFKLREGIDVPSTYHCILATPIGSLASYIQTVGRVLRYSPATADSVLVTDHGGNYLRHGSPNDDRDWQAWWQLPEHAVSEMHTKNIREGKVAEPICCPKCQGERKGGRKCPHCGYEHEKSKRHVVMEDGRLVERDGRLVKPARIVKKPDTERLWEKMFWGYRKKGLERSFAQMRGHFIHEHHYTPPNDLPFMPKNEFDWYQKVHEVPLDRLQGYKHN